jgi:DNA-binding beta-propeller fold protein YncE
MARRPFGIFSFALLLLVPFHLASAGVTASFRYALSNFSGPVRSQWAKLAVDPERNEIYALHQRKNDIRIFDEHGMELFVFGEGFASAADITVGDDGNIFVLSTGYETSTVHLLNYRGEPVSEIALKDVPPAFSEFTADRLAYSRGSLYLVDSNSLMVVVVDEDGLFERGYDLKPVLKPFLPREDDGDRKLANFDWKKKRLDDIDLKGFTVDDQQNMFFTVPVLFSAFRMSAGGEVTPFGRAGSGPGKFGVAAGIATDDEGYVYVSDRLRCVVLIFDPELRFQTEFGHRGDGTSNLIVPDDLAIDRNGNVYVGQAANRGVSVFRVAHEKASRPQSGEKESGLPGRERTIRSKRSNAGETASPSRPREQASQSREGTNASRSEAGEQASPAQGGNTKSTGSGKYGRTIEEETSKRLEFVVDHGDDTPSADSEEGGWTVEGNESNQLEIIGNEKD